MCCCSAPVNAPRFSAASGASHASGYPVGVCQAAHDLPVPDSCWGSNSKDNSSLSQRTAWHNVHTPECALVPAADAEPVLAIKDDAIQLAATKPAVATLVRQVQEKSSDDEDIGFGNVEDDIDSLLRPGGSPCLPMEEGWPSSRAVQRIAGRVGGGVTAAPTSNSSDDDLMGCIDRTPLSGVGELVRRCVSRGRSSFNLAAAEGEGDDKGDRASSDDCSECRGPQGCRGPRQRAAPPPPPLSRHRACQLGYTDSAPAHSTAAAAAGVANDGAMCDIALMAFLRAPEAAAWRVFLGGMLSAPPGPTAAAAAAVATASWRIREIRKPLTAAEGAAALAPEALERAVLRPLVVDEVPSWDPMMSGEFKRRPAAGFGFNCNYDVGPEILAADESQVSRWPLSVTTNCSPEPAELNNSSLRSSLVNMESSFTNASVKEASGGGFFGTPLENGLASLLDGLVAGNCEGKGGKVLQEPESATQSNASRVEVERGQKQDAGHAAARVGKGGGSARRLLGRGLLACFTGHGLDS